MFSFVLYEKGKLYNIKHGWVNNELSITIYDIESRQYDEQKYNVEFADDVSNPRILDGKLYYFHVVIDLTAQTIARSKYQPSTANKDSKHYIYREDNKYYVRQIADNKTVLTFTNSISFRVDNIIMCGKYVAVAVATNLPPYVDYMDQYKPVAYVFGYDLIAL